MNGWKNIIVLYKRLENDNTRPRLQSRTQNICFVISISAVILKLMVKNHKHFRLIL